MELSAIKELKESFTKSQRVWLGGTAIAGGLLACVVAPLLFKLFLAKKAFPAGAGIVLHLAGQLLIALPASIFLYSAILLARRRGFTAKRILVVAALAAFPVTSVALSVTSWHAAGAITAIIGQSSLKTTLMQKLAAAPTMEKKARLSRVYAATVYEEDGIIISHLRPDGTEEKFHPDREAIRNREIFAAAESAMRVATLSSAITAFLWSIAALAAALAAMTRKVET